EPPEGVVERLPLLGRYARIVGSLGASKHRARGPVAEERLRTLEHQGILASEEVDAPKMPRQVGAAVLEAEAGRLAVRLAAHVRQPGRASRLGVEVGQRFQVLAAVRRRQQPAVRTQYA